MAQLLMRADYDLVDTPDQAGVLIVNTCGFIGPAKDESFRVLGELADSKQDGQLLIAAGCLTQRYGIEVAKQVPGIDGILGTSSLDRYCGCGAIPERTKASRPCLPSPRGTGMSDVMTPVFCVPASRVVLLISKLRMAAAVLVRFVPSPS